MKSERVDRAGESAPPPPPRPLPATCGSCGSANRPLLTERLCRPCSDFAFRTIFWRAALGRMQLPVEMLEARLGVRLPVDVGGTPCVVCNPPDAKLSCPTPVTLTPESAAPAEAPEPAQAVCSFCRHDGFQLRRRYGRWDIVRTLGRLHPGGQGPRLTPAQVRPRARRTKGTRPYQVAPGITRNDEPYDQPGVSLVTFDRNAVLAALELYAASMGQVLSPYDGDLLLIPGSVQQLTVRRYRKEPRA